MTFVSQTKINNNYIPKMRTISQAYKAIKEADPNTAFTMRALRRMVNNNEIPTVSIGNKKLINLDLLISILACNNNDDDIRVS